MSSTKSPVVGKAEDRSLKPLTAKQREALVAIIEAGQAAEAALRAEREHKWRTGMSDVELAEWRARFMELNSKRLAAEMRVARVVRGAMRVLPKDAAARLRGAT